MIKSNIQLLEIKISNFGPFYGDHKFEFDDEGGFHRIIGENLDYANDIGASEAADEDQVTSSNGAAKSFFVKSIGFALFGKVPNNDKINLDSLVNKEKGYNMEVMLRFSIIAESTDEYKVHRYHLHKKHKSKLLLLKKNDKDEWIDISFAEKKLTQEAIEGLFMMNFETFTKTSSIARDGARNFLELRSYERGLVIESIARSDKFFKYTSKIKVRIRELRKDLEYERIEKEKLKSSIDTLISQIRKDIQSKKQKRNSLLSSMQNTKNYLDEINMWGLKQEDHNEIDKLLDHLVEKKNKVNQLMLKKKDFENKKDLLDRLESKVETSFGAVESVEKKLNDTKNSKGFICESCGEIANITEHNKHISNLEKELVYCKNIHEKNLKEFDVIKKEYHSVEKIFEDAKVKMKKFLEFDVNLKDDIKEYVKAEFAKGNKQTYINEIKYQQSELQEEEKKLISILDVSSIKEMRNDIMLKRDELKAKENNISILSKRLSMNEWWDERLDFRNDNSIKQHIFAKLVPVFNTTLATYLNIAYENKMQVTFDSSFNESITYNDLQYNYYELSTGEKAKLNLVINFVIFSLTRINLKSINVMFLDEVFTAMDESTIKKFISILENFYVKKNDLVVYIISHSHGIENAFNPKSKIFIRKKNGKSSIYVD